MSNYIFKVKERTLLSPRIKKIKTVFMIIFIFLIASHFLPWQQTVKGEGSVVAYAPVERDYHILAVMDGLIKKFHVQENTFVKKGTPLFTMVDVDQNYLERLKEIEKGFQQQYANAKEQLKNLAKNQYNLQAYLDAGLQSYIQQKKKNKNKILSLKQQKISLHKNLEIEESQYARTKLLFKDGITSRRDLEISENTYIKSQAELTKINLDIENERLYLQVIKNEREKFKDDTKNKLQDLKNSILSKETSIEIIVQNLHQSSANIARYRAGEVTAENDGYVVRILQNNQHRLVKQGEQVMLFSPNVTTKSILLKVSDFNMPLVKKGLKARIIFYGWPALQIPGWPKIQFGSYGGIIRRVERSLNEDGFYYVQVLEDPEDPWPKGNDLRIGTRATAWIRLNTVPIWYQLWRLMNALPPQMKVPKVDVEI